jgi:hypothetical protein
LDPEEGSIMLLNELQPVKPDPKKPVKKDEELPAMLKKQALSTSSKTKPADNIFLKRQAD